MGDYSKIGLRGPRGVQGLAGFSRFGAGAFGVCLLAVLAAPVHAQTAIDSQNFSTSAPDPKRQSNTSKVAAEIGDGDDRATSDDRQRVDDRYQPKGVELGKFLFLPDVMTAGGYNSNVYTTTNNAKSDLFARVVPSFRLQSRFDRHALNLSGEAEKIYYRRYTSDNVLNGRLYADGRYDLFRGTEITGQASYYAEHEDRGSPDAVNGQYPTPVFGNRQFLAGKHTEGPWLFSADVSRHQMIFKDVPGDNGVIIQNQGRNRTEYRASGRVGYELIQGYYALGQVSGNIRDYNLPVDYNGVDRSSRGYAAQGGVGVDLSQLIRGDFLVGYFKQDYNSSTLQNPSGLAVRAVFNWTPDKQTLIVPSLERSVLESTTAGASSMVRTALTALVRREIQRNLVGSIFGGVYYDAYEGLGKSTWTYEGKISTTYAFNENVYTGADIGYRQRNAPVGVSNSYSQLIGMIRLGVRM